jgi:2-polyprenyl-3-methyl-5-hydroxy-6-metoxy-1,4-benzoquinol methylase
MMEATTDPGWNHNIHHHGLVLAAVPASARRGLDAGCGEGLLAARLQQVMPEVTGIDTDAGCIAAARRDHDRQGLEFLAGDFLTADLEPASFDFISCVAMLHHLDTSAGLRRMRELLRPGGRLIVIGCARTASPADLGAELASGTAHKVLSRRRNWAQSTAPVLKPSLSYGQVRRLARAELPGSSFRRRLLWRYSLIWTKPVS